MSRLERGIKDAKKVKLYRYQDPLMGPRTIPNPADMLGSVLTRLIHVDESDDDRDAMLMMTTTTTTATTKTTRLSLEKT